MRIVRLSFLPSMLLALSAGINAQAATQQDAPSQAILLQGFHWHSWNTNGRWYDILASKAADLRDLGVSHVWFPPPSDSAASEGYLPRRLNELNSNYGSVQSLRAATAALRANGIGAIADVVINHRVGNTGWGDFRDPDWSCNAVARDDEWPDACGGADSGEGYPAARDLDHAQPQVQNELKTWLSQTLKGAGFTGIRFDFSKGYAGSYARLYHDAMQPDFCVGEVWNGIDYNNIDGHRQPLMDYIDATGGRCGAFDFTTKALLNQALTADEYGRLKDSAGKPAGAIGWYPQKSVTFVDNHDTGPSEHCNTGQNLWPVPCDKVMQAYAYILTHPGIPTLYYPHVYDWNLRPTIKSLTGIRRDAGINSTSPVTIQAARQGLYAAIIGGTKTKVAMKIGGADWSPGTDWEMAAFGKDYAVWTQTTERSDR